MTVAYERGGRKILAVLARKISSTERVKRPKASERLSITFVWLYALSRVGTVRGARTHKSICARCLRDRPTGGVTYVAYAITCMVRLAAANGYVDDDFNYAENKPQMFGPIGCVTVIWPCRRSFVLMTGATGAIKRRKKRNDDGWLALSCRNDRVFTRISGNE